MGFKGAVRAIGAGLAMLAFAAGWPATAGWPNAIPAQPLVQADRVCAAGVVALNRRCKVIDFAKLGENDDGRMLYYAFYGTRWADRHGRMERGFPVIFYLQRPATLRLSLWVNDEPGLAGRWATTPPARPVLIKRADGTYLGFTLKAIRDPDDQRLFHQVKTKWKEIDVLHRSEEDQDRLKAAMPKGCDAADDGVYDWEAFRLTVRLRETLSRGPCGAVTAELTVRENHLNITSATYLRAEPKERIAPSPSGGPLTLGPASHTSTMR